MTPQKTRNANNSVKIKASIYSLEESAACLPLIVFIELIPGLKTCSAPLQHRPTEPNIVKMAEGE